MVYLYQQPEDSGFPEFSALGRAHSTRVIEPQTHKAGAIAFRDFRPRFEEENEDGAPFKRPPPKKRLEHRLEEKAQQNRPKSPTICILSSELVPRRVKAPPPELRPNSVALLEPVHPVLTQGHTHHLLR